MRERVRGDGLQPASAGRRDHFGVQIDAARADAGRLEQREKLAAAAADVQDVARAGEQRHMHALLVPDFVDRPAKSILEADVQTVGGVATHQRMIVPLP